MEEQGAHHFGSLGGSGFHAFCNYSTSCQPSSFLGLLLIPPAPTVGRSHYQPSPLLTTIPFIVFLLFALWDGNWKLRVALQVWSGHAVDHNLANCKMRIPGSTPDRIPSPGAILRHGPPFRITEEA